ncbi:hypothetical protein OAA60_03665 [Porticoccaceae bacterium]|jgi:hypothetical protein|nr:hypothetical protein [Porticoccaceae bacterium]
MNSCGINIPRILEQFVEINEIEKMEEDYYFSEWYDTIKDVCFTPKSLFFKINQKHSINEAIKSGYSFIRLDTCSPKYYSPINDFDEMKRILFLSDRTRPYMQNRNHIIILRKFIPRIVSEFRCYVHDNKFRAISGSSILVLDNIELIKKMVFEIVHYSEFRDCSIDFGFVDSKLMLIEINTPVYLFATSGKFDLDNEADCHILFGNYDENICYPIIK